MRVSEQPRHLLPVAYDAVVGFGGEVPKEAWNFVFIDNAGGDFGDWSNISIDFSKAGGAIPEPTSALFLMGIAGLAVARRRR